jgi:iron complex transport system substrate-binding protein
MTKYLNCFAFILCFSLVSCESHNVKTNESILEADKRTIPLNYAQNFSIHEFEWGYKVSVKETKEEKQKEEKLLTYLLVREESSCSIKEEYPRIEIPLKRCALNSSTYLEFLSLLGEMHTLVGLCNAEYIYNDSTYRRVESGKITQLGSIMQVNEEQLLVANPDVLFLSDRREASSLNSSPTIICTEWREQSALGRAEWIKFFALFYDKLSLADSLFRETEARYLSIKSIAAQDTLCPTLFAAAEFGGTWYLTGGLGYMRSIYEDANARFLMADTMVGTVTTGLEWVLGRFHEADYWMNCQQEKKSELDERLSLLSAYQKNRIYHFNKRSIKRPVAVISDFYESAVAHPDRILKDVAAVLHPHLFEGHETQYLGALKNDLK